MSGVNYAFISNLRCSATKLTSGIVWPSNGGEKGTGVSRAPTTTGADSRAQKASSNILLDTVCPNPPLH